MILPKKPTDLKNRTVLKEGGLLNQFSRTKVVAVFCLVCLPVCLFP